MTMKRSLLLPAAAVVASLTWAAPALAGPPAWTMDPGEGPVGTEVTIEGSCAADINEWEAVSFYFETEDGALLAVTTHPITAGETWALPLVVPETEVGPHRIGKQCHRVEDDGSFGGGEATTRQPFEVTEAIDPEPENDPAEAPTARDETEVLAATPASPVAQAPAFTG
jgi:hypothetical protein